jgi:hypothetical protein
MVLNLWRMRLGAIAASVILLVVLPHFESTPITVKTQLPGLSSMFILEVEERAEPDGRLKPVLALHQ